MLRRPCWARPWGVWTYGHGDSGDIGSMVETMGKIWPADAIEVPLGQETQDKDPILHARPFRARRFADVASTLGTAFSHALRGLLRRKSLW